MNDKLQTIITQVEQLSVLELAELVKAMEEKFGVSAAAPAMMMPAMAGAAGGAAAPAEEKTEFDVELTEVGANKINVIKAVKEVTGLGLADAKALVDGVPKVLKSGVKKEDAEAMKKKVEDAGGKVALKQPRLRPVFKGRDLQLFGGLFNNLHNRCYFKLIL